MPVRLPSCSAMFSQNSCAYEENNCLTNRSPASNLRGSGPYYHASTVPQYRAVVASAQTQPQGFAEHTRPLIKLMFNLTQPIGSCIAGIVGNCVLLAKGQCVSSRITWSMEDASMNNQSIKGHVISKHAANFGWLSRWAFNVGDLTMSQPRIQVAQTINCMQKNGHIDATYIWRWNLQRMDQKTRSRISQSIIQFCFRKNWVDSKIYDCRTGPCPKERQKASNLVKF